MWMMNNWMGRMDGEHCSKLQDVHIMAQVCRVDLAHQEFAEELVLWSLQACPGLATMTLPFTTR